MATYVIVISVVIIFQLTMNVSTVYALNIDYQKHKCNMNYTDWLHTYETITINLQVKPSTYEGVLNGHTVDGFPLWVDTATWQEGGTERIGGYDYEISIFQNRWKAYREISSDYYDVLYYHRDIGVLLETRIDRVSLGWPGFSGYTEDIHIVESNIAGFVSRVTGSGILSSFGLVTGIFAEVAAIWWLFQQRGAKTTQ